MAINKFQQTTEQALHCLGRYQTTKDRADLVRAKSLISKLEWYLEDEEGFIPFELVGSFLSDDAFRVLHGCTKSEVAVNSSPNSLNVNYVLIVYSHDNFKGLVGQIRSIYKGFKEMNLKASNFTRLIGD